MRNVAIGAVTALTALAFAATAMAGQATDLMIGKTVAGIGQNVYDPVGTQQTVTEMADRGDAADWGVELENDAGGVAQFLMDGCSSTGRFKVKYFEYFGGNRNNVTDALANAKYGPILDSGGVAQLEVVIKPTNKADRGDVFNCPISGDTNPSTLPEVVVARLKVT